MYRKFAFERGQLVLGRFPHPDHDVWVKVHCSCRSNQPFNYCGTALEGTTGILLAFVCVCVCEEKKCCIGAKRLGSLYRRVLEFKELCM